ncbi:maleylacetoacetate isomerase [Azospirillum sp. TSO22-1]|uniref:maleylacetoacetate isomerase n=1 Tax=Azospirillum sp. TSO22-1 TaxID=716789 RepID=UPI000D614392|nr:maleylacetoacetate isomerase [Azospirillum sp. TSO22-1]PWC53487.1 maleylacetoacetate isomerase [Azospirillum sp. TSO22-1]
MKLHNYHLSSASFRVRIALNLKGLPFTYVSHHLRRAEHRSEAFLRLNPQGLVPALELDDGAVLTQSMAIVEFLDEAHPEPPLLPRDLHGRARVRALAQAIACDIHPINNLRVLQYLETPLGHDQATRDAWYRHWVAAGFDGLERELAGHPATGRFCHGDAPTLADICLVPQVFNAKRFAVDLGPYPTVRRIHGVCLDLPAFADAAPEKQPEAAT